MYFSVDQRGTKPTKWDTFKKEGEEEEGMVIIKLLPIGRTVRICFLWRKAFSVVLCFLDEQEVPNSVISDIVRYWATVIFLGH